MRYLPSRWKQDKNPKPLQTPKKIDLPTQYLSVSISILALLDMLDCLLFDEMREFSLQVPPMINTKIIIKIINRWTVSCAITNSNAY